MLGGTLLKGTEFDPGHSKPLGPPSSSLPPSSLGQQQFLVVARIGGLVSRPSGQDAGQPGHPGGCFEAEPRPYRPSPVGTPQPRNYPGGLQHRQAVVSRPLAGSATRRTAAARPGMQVRRAAATASVPAVTGHHPHPRSLPCNVAPGSRQAQRRDRLEPERGGWPHTHNASSASAQRLPGPASPRTSSEFPDRAGQLASSSALAVRPLE